MRKSFRAFWVLMLFAAPLFAQITNTVTFNIDMTHLIKGGFNPAVDSVKIEGLTWNGNAKLDSTSTRILAPSVTDPNIYSTTIIIHADSSAVVGDSLRWKLYIWPSDKITTGSWEEGFPRYDSVDYYDGRPYILRENNAVVSLPAEIPNFKYVALGLGPQNTYHIMADLTDIIGTGEGFFDPTQDGIEVQGMNWPTTGIVNGKANLVSGDRKMTQNPLLPGVIFETTLVMELDTAFAVGDSLRWKFAATPGSRWSNGGYENGVGRWLVFRPAGTELELGPFKPDLVANFTLKKESKILFQADLNHNATNRYDSSAIPLNEVKFLTIRGSHKMFGSWSGSWTEKDTIGENKVPVLNDSGIYGDKVAGDNIWSRLITFPVNSIGGQTSYKYGIYYTGCEQVSVPVNSFYMDGFAGEGGDKTCAILERSETLEILDMWPNHKNSVSVKQIGGNAPSKFMLNQNYPNPFNPTTTIKYEINKSANVNLNIYNVLGQKVMELVNTTQNAGTYVVKFDGASLSSGIYLYRLSSGSNVVTKKMLLLK